ncbi:MAG TPA: hypothetical protein VML94_08695 [Thermoplasmata archaeon]|nr:hypothetical protein [Thermoplasmata archaeon]
MKKVKLPLDIAVLYIACGLPIIVLGLLTASAYAIDTGALLTLVGFVFLLGWGIHLLRQRPPAVKID